MSAAAIETNDLETIADELVECRGDPERFVDRMFDWQSPDLKGKAPEPWQREVLRTIRDGLPLGKAIRIAVASGHGVGKTALVSWICLWAMATCTDCRGILTASNEAQLATRNRAELRKWYRLFRGRAFFELTATALISADLVHSTNVAIRFVALERAPARVVRRPAQPTGSSSSWTRRR